MSHFARSGQSQILHNLRRGTLRWSTLQTDDSRRAASAHASTDCRTAVDCYPRFVADLGKYQEVRSASTIPSCTVHIGTCYKGSSP